MINQKPKKEVSPWYLAATHFLTAGFVVPFLFGIVLAILLAFLFPILGEDMATPGNTFIVASFILTTATMIAAVILGIKYSANFIKKKYVIKDTKELVKNSTIIFVILRGGWIIIDVAMGNTLIMSINFFLNTIVFIVMAAIFYKFSEKYLSE